MMYHTLLIIAIISTCVNCSYRDLLDEYLGYGSGLNHDISVYFHGFALEERSIKQWEEKYQKNPQEQEVVETSTKICMQIQKSLTCTGSPFASFVLNNCSKTIYGNVNGSLFAVTKLTFPQARLRPLGLFTDLSGFQHTLWNITRYCDSFLTEIPPYLTGSLYVTYTRSTTGNKDIDIINPVKEQVNNILGQARGLTNQFELKPDKPTVPFGKYNLVGYAEGFVLRKGRNRRWTEDMMNQSTSSYKVSRTATLKGINQTLLCPESRLLKMGVKTCREPLFGSVDGWVYSSCELSFSKNIANINLLQMQQLIDLSARDCSKKTFENYTNVQNFVTYKSVELLSKNKNGRK